MAILIPQRWARQPQYNTGIDWSNPLTRGLQSLWRFDQLVDAVKNKRFGITDSTDMTKSSPTMFGVGTKREAASTLGTGYIDLDAPLTSDFTLLTVHVPTSGNMLLDYDGSPRTLQFRWFSNNGVQFIYFNTAGSPFFSTITGAGSFVNRLCVSAAVKKGALITAYTQGIAAPSDTITGTPQSPPTVLRAFNRRDATFAGYNGVQIYSAWYNRALSSEEIAQISENPWQLFRPQSAPVTFFAPAIGTDALLANDLQSLSQLSTPALGQKHALLANDLQSTSSVQTVALGQKHVLLANDLESTSSVQTVALGQKHALLANDLESTSSVQTVALGQKHALLANDLESTSSVQTVALGQKHVLLANDLESLSQLSQPALTSSGGLLANDLESTSSVQTVALGQKHNLLANDLESTSSVQTTILSQKHVLLANDLQNLSQISSPAIGGGGAFALLANDLESATQLSIPVLRQKRQVNYATSVTIASLNGVTFYHNGGKWYGY